MRTELHVPSDLKFLTIVESWLLGCLQTELGESVDWPRQANRLRLVLVEAYSNIVRHAHKDQPNLPVLMRLELKGRDISLELWDYGRGYDLSTYLPPNPEDLQEHGYGWLILNRLMDRVEYRLQVNGRNCLTLGTTLPNSEPLDQESGTDGETHSPSDSTSQSATEHLAAESDLDTHEHIDDTWSDHKATQQDQTEGSDHHSSDDRRVNYPSVDYPATDGRSSASSVNKAKDFRV